jgi:hypothetical protein
MTVNQNEITAILRRIEAQQRSRSAIGDTICTLFRMVGLLIFCLVVAFLIILAVEALPIYSQ